MKQKHTTRHVVKDGLVGTPGLGHAIPLEGKCATYILIQLELLPSPFLPVNPCPSIFQAIMPMVGRFNMHSRISNTLVSSTYKISILHVPPFTCELQR